MTQHFISGIQQIGIGIPDVYEAWRWYRNAFGMDIPVFDEAAEAKLMLPYTGGKPQKRHAVLALNLQGGGGFEIWQYTGRTPQPPTFTPELGDLGLFVTKIKSKDVQATYRLLEHQKYNLLGKPVLSPAGTESFFVKDPYNNIFQIEPSDDWFCDDKKLTGGPSGIIIGVSDMEKSMNFYQKILGYDKVLYDAVGAFNDFAVLPGGNKEMRRVLLTHSETRKGAFSQLLGKTFIELVQVYNKPKRSIYENRLWGDLGFIHLCFDMVGIDSMREYCKANGHPFTVDSAQSFDMGEAAGHFSYIEDPDGTLIEFVETHKIPVLKKIGWYLNLRKRQLDKPLPKWMLRALRFNRVK